MQKRNKRKLFRPADALLSLALLLAALAGRDALATRLFLCLYLIKLCALASADGLRAAFALQPAMRWVQGSAAAALLSQIAGAALAAPLWALLSHAAPPWALLGCGLLLNIERVFYEYLYAVGDGGSATLCRLITSLLALAGLLCAAPGHDAPTASPAWLPATAGLSALVGLVISLAMGGKPRPRLNAAPLRIAPASLLQTALYPALALLLARLLLPGEAIGAPLFAGLALYELCRTPFRRSPAEAAPMLRALAVVAAAALLTGLALALTPAGQAGPLHTLLLGCGAVLLAAACAAALFGNLYKRGEI